MIPGGIRKADLHRSVGRESFQTFLPWVAFDPETKAYLTQEGAMGYIWECTPLAFMSNGVAETLSGIFGLEYPENAVIQFLLYADDHVAPFIAAFKNETDRDDDVVQRWSDDYANYLEQGASGLPKMSGIPTRRFRVFVAVKNGESGDQISEDTITGIEEFLRGAHLNPRRMEASELLALVRGILGAPPVDRYDDEIPIRKQVLRAQDEVSVKKDHIVIGDRFYKVLTPKLLPEKIDVLKANELFGGVYGAQSDPEQIDSPFIYSLTILPKDMKTSIAAKAEAMNFQRSTGSFISQLKRRLEEYDWALGMADKTRFMRIIPSLVVFGATEEKMRSTAARLRRMWESKGAVMQEERAIQQVVFTCSLPLGLYNDKRFVANMDRYFVVQTQAIATLLPVQADFMGAWPPRLAYVGRKGQLIGLDIFNRSATNHNILIAAGSGAGKSVSTQHMLLSHYRSGCQVRVVDIGYSYRKLTNILNGSYIDIDENVVLNPFDFIHDESGVEICKAVILQMCYANMASVPNEISYTLVNEAVEWAIAQNQPERGVSLVRHFLATYPKHSAAEVSDHLEHVITEAHTLAYTMRDFDQDGKHGRMFNGRSTVRVDDADWMVLELEALINKPALFNVVTLMVLNLVTASLYLADAETRVPTFILFDEAWKFLSSAGNAGQQSSIATVIEEGMRRARKYYGSFSIVTQSIADTEKFGTAGDVIRSNTQFKFLLMSGDYQQAKDRGLIDYDPFSLSLLKSVKTQRPRYSEIFIDGGDAFGKGVARLVLDPFSYWLLTSDAEDNRRIETQVRQGKTYAEAIASLAADAA